MKVYFDQWVWIELARAYYGFSTKYEKECNQVIKASNKGVIFPLSINHLIETHKRQNIDSRNRLAKFMLMVSKGNTILPWVFIKKPEIKNVINSFLNIPPEDLSSFVFGKGIPKLVGGIPELIPKSPNSKLPTEEELTKINNFLFSEQSVSLAFLDENISKTYAEKQQEDEELAIKLEKLREKNYIIKNKKKKRDIEDVKYLIDMIMNPFLEEIFRLQQNPQEFLSKYFKKREDFENLLKNIPTLHVFHELNYARNINSSRPIKSNDIYDLGALSIAIPYCDIVVTERQWTNICKDKMLDKKNNTTITYKIEDLNELLNKQ